MLVNIPNKIVTCSDKDAPWINNEVTSAIRRNSRVYRKWVLNSCTKDNVRKVQNDSNRLIKKPKNYFNNLGSKLNDSTTDSKTFWTAFKCPVNKKKLANIPPLLEDVKMISDFNRKCPILNDFYAKQCTLNVTSSGIPPINMLTDSRLPLIASSEAKVADIILKLNFKRLMGMMIFL